MEKNSSTVTLETQAAWNLQSATVSVMAKLVPIRVGLLDHFFFPVNFGPPGPVLSDKFGPTLSVMILHWVGPCLKDNKFGPA